MPMFHQIIPHFRQVLLSVFPCLTTLISYKVSYGVLALSQCPHRAVIVCLEAHRVSVIPSYLGAKTVEIFACSGGPISHMQEFKGSPSDLCQFIHPSSTFLTLGFATLDTAKYQPLRYPPALPRLRGIHVCIVAGV